ncbi:MAG: hypothetical protein P8N31_03950 [Planctomycetota bacterium]|nr:hypothetical protein [Planctomycetota bacterium]MDG2142688.1 hypothetical protein [Planctomycetota bacterium]
MKSSFQAAVLLSSLFLSSCVFAVGTTADGETATDYGHEEMMAEHDEQQIAAVSAEDNAPAMAEKKPAKEVDLGALEFDLMMAELELQSAQASQARAMESAQHGVFSAERGLALAKDELAHFENVAMPLAAAESDLSMDRTRGRLDDSKAELQQLVDMYGAEEFAESTKELVLTRGKRGVEQSERSLELAQRRAEDKQAFEMGRKRDSLVFKVSEAERSLKLRVDAIATAEMDGKVKLMRAENKLQKAIKKLDDAANEAN